MLCEEQEASTNGLEKSKVLEALYKASLKWVIIGISQFCWKLLNLHI